MQPFMKANLGRGLEREEYQGSCEAVLESQTDTWLRVLSLTWEYVLSDITEGGFVECRHILFTSFLGN